MNFIGIAVCVLWGAVALFGAMSFVTVLQNCRRAPRRVQAVVVEKGQPCRERRSKWRTVLEVGNDEPILFSIDGQTRALFAGPGLYADLREGDSGLLTYRDGRVMRIERKE